MNDRKIYKNKGLTLIEMLIVIAIIAALSALVLPLLTGVKREAFYPIAFSEMTSIKKVIRDRFYPELGLIPEDLGQDGSSASGDETPEYAIRYLCLFNDKDNDGERGEMFTFIEDRLLSTTQADKLIKWDKYSRMGWRGEPYLEREAIAYENDGTPYPVIIDPWGSVVDSTIDPDEVVGEYRIFGGQDKNLAQIVSYGENGMADCDVVMDSGGKNYVCITEHVSSASNRPITGGDWKKYWALDNTQLTTGSWLSNTDYETFKNDDIAMSIFGRRPTIRP